MTQLKSETYGGETIGFNRDDYSKSVIASISIENGGFTIVAKTKEEAFDIMKKEIDTLSTSISSEPTLLYVGKKVKLVDDNGDMLASLTLNYDSEQAINISAWKAKIKGKGYGKKLLEMMLDERPNVFQINTDGTTQMGRANLLKALPDWKFVDERKSFSAAMALLMRQDAIDYFIDKRGGRMSIFQLDPSLHS